MITIRQLDKSFDGGQSFAVRDLSLQVEPGETLVLLGSSGSGKSTTLKMINRLIEPTAGLIEIDGVNVQDVNLLELRRSIGYVFQGIGLFPHLSVEDNVSIVGRLLGWPRSRRHKRAWELLELVELDPADYAERYPRQLSGGQQQRVGVARALAADPPHMLMDEPFGALDALTRDSLQQEVLRLKHRLGKTIVFVTHDLFEALTLGDRIAILHEGKLEQVGTKADVLGSPATPFVEELFTRPARQLDLLKEQLS